MRLMALALVTVLALSGCQTTSDASESAEVRYTGGDGTSADTAVVISGPRNSMEGVPAEYAWIQRNLPGAKIESQSLCSWHQGLRRFRSDPALWRVQKSVLRHQRVLR
jgi:hypothetical protein